MMGLSFDGNGKYVGWSNLFDYSSEETIKASEYLPMPKQKIYEVTLSGTNIDEFILKIIQADNSVKRINGYVDLLNYLNDNDITLISYTIQEGYEVVKNIRSHEFTKIPYILLEDATKNFISSHILNTIQNLRNMVGAYSPIEMEDFREASEKSPKGELTSNLTLFDPSTKLIMLHLNIIGKNVIGIAANGEKASFMWHYYINDVIKKINPFFNDQKYQDLLNAEIDNVNLSSNIKYSYIDIKKYLTNSMYREKVINSYSNILQYLPTLDKVNPLVDKIKYSLFSLQTSRIKGRDSGKLKSVEITSLPDINLEDIDLKVKSIYKSKLKEKGDITVDLMISQVLSAATDNAKELILGKVNAGSKLAKMYLFMITLGFDINDIVKFMTSPVATFIDTVTETNIFINQNIEIKDAIDLARGNFNKFYKQFLSNRTLNSSLLKEGKKKLAKGELIENPFEEETKEYIELENALDAISEIKFLLQEAINTEINNSEKTEQEVKDNMLLDLDEFENILEGAEEFSNFGKLLGLNQGLPNNKVSILERIQSIQMILSSRITAVNKANKKKSKKQLGFKYNEIKNTPLDVKKYLNDPEYKQNIKNLYNSVKKCINIFDVVDHIPLFNSIFEIFSGVLVVDDNISIKSKIYNKVYDQLKAEGWYMSEDYQKRLLKGIDDVIIAKFVNLCEISIPYPKDSVILDILRNENKTKKSGILHFDSLNDVASFKYLFENTIIPNLKNGIIYDYQKGKVVKITDEDLKANKFINSLIKGYYKGVPLYKCDLDMLTTEKSMHSKLKLQLYVKGLLLLLKIKINGTSLSDLFVLYNLIVNKNQYGSDRMTTLFASFIKNHGELSLIRKYLKYIGDIDWKGDLKEFNVSVLDLMAQAAIVVNSEFGQKDPVIIVNTESGPELKIRNKGRYIIWDKKKLIPEIKGENKDNTLRRIYINNGYFVLGGLYSEKADRQIKNIIEINSETLNDINNLIKEGILTILKICK